MISVGCGEIDVETSDRNEVASLASKKIRETHPAFDWRARPRIELRDIAEVDEPGAFGRDGEEHLSAFQERVEPESGCSTVAPDTGSDDNTPSPWPEK